MGVIFHLFIIVSLICTIVLISLFLDHRKQGKPKFSIRGVSIFGLLTLDLLLIVLFILVIDYHDLKRIDYSYKPWKGFRDSLPSLIKKLDSLSIDYDPLTNQVKFSDMNNNNLNVYFHVMRTVQSDFGFIELSITNPFPFWISDVSTNITFFTLLDVKKNKNNIFTSTIWSKLTVQSGFSYITNNAFSHKFDTTLPGFWFIKTSYKNELGVQQTPSRKIITESFDIRSWFVNRDIPHNDTFTLIRSYLQSKKLW